MLRIVILYQEDETSIIFALMHQVVETSILLLRIYFRGER